MRQVSVPSAAAALLVVGLCLASSASASVGFTNCTRQLINGFVPDGPAGNVKICRDGEIAIAYDPVMVNPAYSAYYVTPEDLTHVISGRDSFYADPDLKALGIKQASDYSDAFNESWNRGHLCPNHILSYSEAGKHATFTMANVAPQAAYFNQHPWNELESKIFDWVRDHEPLHIITAVAYKNRTTPRRSFDDISVPDYYVKVMCDVKAGQSVAFVGDNNGDGGDYVFEMRTVADAERIYGGWLLPEAECDVFHVDKTHWWSEATLRRLKVRVSIDLSPVLLPPRIVRPKQQQL